MATVDRDLPRVSPSWADVMAGVRSQVVKITSPATRFVSGVEDRWVYRGSREWKMDGPIDSLGTGTAYQTYPSSDHGRSGQRPSRVASVESLLGLANCVVVRRLVCAGARPGTPVTHVINLTCPRTDRSMTFRLEDLEPNERSGAELLKRLINEAGTLVSATRGPVTLLHLPIGSAPTP